MLGRGAVYAIGRGGKVVYVLATIGRSRGKGQMATVRRTDADPGDVASLGGAGIWTASCGAGEMDGAQPTGRPPRRRYAGIIGR